MSYDMLLGWQIGALCGALLTLILIALCNSIFHVSYKEKYRDLFDQIVPWDGETNEDYGRRVRKAMKYRARW